MTNKTKIKYEGIFLTTTDTVTGLGCYKIEDLETIFQLKNRPKNKKIIILVGSIEQARKFPEWNEKAETLAKKYWPGNVSLIVNNQGFRMPNHPGLIELLLEKGPAFVTSANISGQEVLDIEKAQKVFPEIQNVYNFGRGSNIPSKIIDVETEKELR